MFGSYFGKKEIVELMVNHPVAKQLYSKRRRSAINKYGHLFFKLFGYPLSVTGRQRASVILTYLDPKRDERILDAGCGIGYYAFELATKFGCKVNGVDIDAEDIELAEKIKQKMLLPTVEFSISNICELNFDDETFDDIILSEVLEHVEDDLKALIEMYRVLKPHRHLILSTPHVDTMDEYIEQKPKSYKKPDIKIEGGHVRNGYSFEKLSKLLTDAGFDVAEHCFVNKKFTKNADFPLFLLLYPISKLDNFLKELGRL